MQRPPEPPNPWGLLCSFPGWRGLRETLWDLTQQLWSIGGEASDLAESLATLLEDPWSVRAEQAPNYTLHVPLQKRRLTEPVDLENDLPNWLSDLARILCDVPVLLAAADAAEHLGPALSADLPRTLQVRYADLVQQIRQALLGRSQKTVARARGPEPDLQEIAPGLRFAAAQSDCVAVVVPRAAEATVIRTAWYESALLLLREHGLDAARLHLRLQSAWPGSLAYGEAEEALGLRRDPERRAFSALQQLQGLRLSCYTWEHDGGSIRLEHQARDLWTTQLQEGGQARLVEEDGAVVARGREWWATPNPRSWIAALPSGTVNGDEARSLLDVCEGRRNPFSLAIGLCLAAGVTRLTNHTILTLAGLDLEHPQPALWTRLRAAVRLQERAGWVVDPRGWPKRGGDWEAFLAAPLRWERSGGTDQSISAPM